MNINTSQKIRREKSQEISKKVNLIQDNFQQIEKILEDYSSNKSFLISARDASSMQSDADLSLDLILDDKVIATAGVSVGLENYYNDVILYDNQTELEKMISSSGSDFVVTLMQSARGRKSERSTLVNSGVDYRTELMICLDKVSSTISPILFYLPGKFVYWNLFSIRELSPYGAPLESILRKNYDDVAKNFGFKFNPSSNLYER